MTSLTEAWRERGAFYPIFGHRAFFLWARLDPVAAPAIAEMLAGEIPGAQLSWIEDLDYSPMLEGPARWALAARAFLDAIDAAHAGA